MSTTINKNLTFNAVQDILLDNTGKFYVEIFKKLLTAINTGDFTELSRTPNEIINKYNTMHSKVESFVMNHIYDNIYTSEPYDALMNALIDIYAAMYTIVDLRGNITDISVQPDCVVDAYLDSFGFKGKELFNYIQKREICKIIYWYLRRKGTPFLIINLLNILGFSYFFIAEFNLYETNDIESPSKHKYISRLIYEEKPQNAGIGFYFDTEYSHMEVKESDPLNIKDDTQLSEDEYMTYPAQTPYYQMGISVTYPDMERRINAFTYAMIKKTYLDQQNGEDIFLLKVTDYNNKKVSFISLVLGYTYIMGEYFGIYDSNLYEKVNVDDYYSEETFDPDNIDSSKPKLYTKDGNDYNLEAYFDYNFDGTKVDYNEDAYIVKNSVFGWQKDITNQSALDIMYDIDREIKRLNVLLKWQKDEKKSDSETNSDYERNITLIDNSKLTVYEDNIYTRKRNALNEIKKIFYGAPIWNSYNDSINAFIEHDNSFKNFIDNIILSKEERIKLINSEDQFELSKNFDNVIELLNNILEAIEYYIFDNTSFIIPVKNYIISYDKLIELLKKVDEYYTPYHSKLLNPMIAWMIRDLPGDNVAISDLTLMLTSESSIRDYIFRANHYNTYDNDSPEPYTPIYDWKNNSNNPHLPTPIKYTDAPLYDRFTILKNNPFITAIGYFWLYLDQYPLMIRGEPYNPQYDWNSDRIKSECVSILVDAFDIHRPDHKILQNIKEVEDIINSKKVYTKTYSEIISANTGVKIFNIKHKLNSKDLFVCIYDIKTGDEVECSVTLINNDNISITLRAPVINEETQYKVLIIAPTLEVSENNNICSQMFNIINHPKLKDFLLYTDLYTRDIFSEIYDKDLGEKYFIKTRRASDRIVYASYNTINEDDDIERKRLKIDLVGLIDDTNKNNTQPKQALFESYIFEPTENNHSFEITHNFRTNNIITRIYDIETNQQVNALIDRIDIKKINVNFSNTIGSGRYKVLLLGIQEYINNTALPINNIVGFSASFKLDGIHSTYKISHNLNTFELFEQVIDKETSEIIKVNIDRINENTIHITFNDEFVKQNTNKEFLIVIFGKLDINTVTFPSTIYNTLFESYLISNNTINLNASISKEVSNNIAICTITHNLNSNNIIAQVYDSHNTKIDCNIQIIDNNIIKLTINNSILLNETIKLNIISLPNKNIPFSNYNTRIKSNNFIKMYDKIVSPSDIIGNQFIEYDGGGAFIEDNEIEYNDYDAGTASSEYNDNILNGGTASTSYTEISQNTYTITHDLSTENVLVNVFNDKTKETINTYVTINNKNSVTIGFLEDIDQSSDDYHVVIIGALSSNSFDDSAIYDLDNDEYITPRVYMEYKSDVKNYISKHISLDLDRYDMSPEIIKHPLTEIDINIQRYDMIALKERVDIIHDIIQNNKIISDHISEYNGFNKHDIISNEPIFDKSLEEDTNKSLEFYMKVEPILKGGV